MKGNMSDFFSLTHPGFFRLPSEELCPSLTERGEKTLQGDLHCSPLVAGCKIVNRKW